MSLPVYRDENGDCYVVVADGCHQIIMDDGSHKPAVLFRGVEQSPGGGFMYRDANTFSTTKERWAERFTPVADSGRPTK